MGNFKGTKGKWVIKHSESKDAFNIIGTIPGGKYKVARVPYIVIEGTENNNEWHKNEAMADAKLIETAPLMFEFLNSIISSENTPIAHRKRAEQLIKKATE